jgi:hypothetical protein
MIIPRLAASLSLLAIVAACVSAPKQPPAPEPVPLRPLPAPSPPPPSPPSPAPADWADIPLTPGEWRYSEGLNGPAATYITAGGGFAVRCDRGRGQVSLSRLDATGASLSIRTSTAARTVDAGLGARDSFLDAIVFSRGRFTVAAPGLPLLVIPSWPEPARVLEECRG